MWRSAHHEGASDEDLTALDALGLETVIDLRGVDEREMHPCRRSDNFSARVLFAGGVTAGLAPQPQAAGGTTDVGTAGDRLIETYARMLYRPVTVGPPRAHLGSAAPAHPALPAPRGAAG